MHTTRTLWVFWNYFVYYLQDAECRQSPKDHRRPKAFHGAEHTRVTTNPHQQKPLFSTPKTITLFDPQQKETVQECERLVNKIFPVTVRGIEWKREGSLKQRDGDSCGPLVLLFFECAVRDIVLPKSPSNALLRYFRLSFLLKALHV
ncbi:hypothetical protein GQ600_16750 [Phytophthora cactorum]|nr:hypothetical protein GQ600_16750 [Phytophthora cactorum]